MPWIGAAIGAGGSLLGGVLGSSGAKKAAKKQVAAQQAALAEQQRQFNIAMGLQQPYAVTGTGAENMLARLYGLPYQAYSAPNLSQSYGSITGGKFGAKDVVKMLKRGMTVEQVAQLGGLKSGKTTKRTNYLLDYGLTPDQISVLRGLAPAQSSQQNPVVTPEGPDMSVFQNSPGYQFRRDEGQRDIGNSFAARGGAFGGDALRALTGFNQNLASEDYYNFVNQLNNMAGHGQTAVTNQGQFGQNFANQASNLLGNQGNARASGIADQTNYLLAGLGGAADAFGKWWDNRRPSASNTSGYGYYTGGA